MDLTSDASLKTEKFIMNKSHGNHQQIYKDDEIQLGLSNQLEMLNKAQHESTHSSGMTCPASVTNNNQKPRRYVSAFNPIAMFYNLYRKYPIYKSYVFCDCPRENQPIVCSW